MVFQIQRLHGTRLLRTVTKQLMQKNYNYFWPIINSTYIRFLFEVFVFAQRFFFDTVLRFKMWTTVWMHRQKSIRRNTKRLSTFYTWYVTIKILFFLICLFRFSYQKKDLFIGDIFLKAKQLKLMIALP
jgi:hypothetical protein